MAGGPAQIHQAAKAAQVERAHHLRRGQHAEPVHPHQEIPHGLVGAEERAEDRPFEAEALRPAVRAFADRVLQMAPHAVERRIGIAHVSAQRVRAA